MVVVLEGVVVVVLVVPEEVVVVELEGEVVVAAVSVL